MLLALSIKVSVSSQGNCVRTPQFLVLDSEPSRKFSDIFFWYFPASVEQRPPSINRFALRLNGTSKLLSDSPSPIQQGRQAKEESEMLIKLILQANIQEKSGLNPSSRTRKSIKPVAHPNPGFFPLRRKEKKNQTNKPIARCWSGPHEKPTIPKPKFPVHFVSRIMHARSLGYVPRIQPNQIPPNAPPPSSSTT